MTDKSGDVDIDRGDDSPEVIWQALKNDIPDDQDPRPEDIFDLTGSILYLTIEDDDVDLITKDTVSNPTVFSFDIPTGKITWFPTIAETLLLPIGRTARYKIERVIAGKRSRLFRPGYVVVHDDD